MTTVTMDHLTMASAAVKQWIVAVKTKWPPCQADLEKVDFRCTKLCWCTYEKYCFWYTSKPF